ncbi:MAG: 5-formyltetrahydrofolate cyclo-ligase [Tepidisphaeraceae bacterium]|jgi:5-formyltetrahydrofolate cyclo-ligase
MDQASDKSQIRRQLKAKLEAMTESDRQAKSLRACSLMCSSPEFTAARVVMLYLSSQYEIDTAPLALRCWQSGKTVVVPKVSWDQRRMLPVEISSLQTSMTTTGPGVREPVSGQPMPLNLIDLVIVPGIGFTPDGHRIGRGMGFYDRFLAQNDFIGLSCGYAFEEQMIPTLPVLDHDMALSMLCTDRGIRRFATNCMTQP